MGKKTPYGQIFTNVFQTPNRGHGNTSFCANFVKFGRPEVGEIARCLMAKKRNFGSSSRCPFCADRAQNLPGTAPNHRLGVPKFHPNPFTSGGVIAERGNIVQTRHKVFAILGEASASSSSNNFRRRIGVVQGHVQLRSLPPAACWRLQAAPGDYSRQMLRLATTTAS